MERRRDERRVEKRRSEIEGELRVESKEGKRREDERCEIEKRVTSPCRIETNLSDSERERSVPSLKLDNISCYQL